MLNGVHGHALCVHVQAMVATGIIGYVAKIEFLGFGNYRAHPHPVLRPGINPGYALVL